VTPFAALRLQDRLHPVNTIRLPGGKDSLRTLLFNPDLKHVFRDHDHAVFFASMIELFILDLIIYLFENLIMQLSNYLAKSTSACGPMMATPSGAV